MYKLFFLFFSILGCDHYIFIFTLIYYDTLDPFQTNKKVLISTWKKKYILLTFRVLSVILFKGKVSNDPMWTSQNYSKDSSIWLGGSPTHLGVL